MGVLEDKTISAELHLDANNTVLELKLTLEDEIEGLTQEMLDAFAEQFVGKQMPVVLRGYEMYEVETPAEEQIVEPMENQQDISHAIVVMLNMLLAQ